MVEQFRELEMKALSFQLILIFLISCSKGGDSGSGGIAISPDSKIKREYSKIRDMNQREFLNVLNSIPILKDRGSFHSISSLEYKQGTITCAGTTDLKIAFDVDSRKYSVSRKVTQTGGNCKGISPTRNYKTGRDLNLSFLYKIVNFKNVKISEGTIQGKKAYMVSNEDKDQTTNYLLSVVEDSLDSLQSEYIYLGNDGYIKISSTISPTSGTKIEENLIEDTPETGDILELSEYPLYDLIG